MLCRGEAGTQIQNARGCDNENPFHVILLFDWFPARPAGFFSILLNADLLAGAIHVPQISAVARAAVDFGTDTRSVDALQCEYRLQARNTATIMQAPLALHCIQYGFCFMDEVSEKKGASFTTAP